MSIIYVSSRSLQASALLHNAFFVKCDLFHPQRWHMVVPALREWTAISICHGIGQVSLELSGQLEQETFGQNQGKGLPREGQGLDLSLIVGELVMEEKNMPKGIPSFGLGFYQPLPPTVSGFCFEDHNFCGYCGSNCRLYFQARNQTQFKSLAGC